MPIGILRQLAFEGVVRKFIYEPPDIILHHFDRVSGVSLKFDDVFLQYAIDEFFDYGHPYLSRGLSRYMKERRRRYLSEVLFNADVWSNGSDLLAKWGKRCLHAGYDSGAKPVLITVDVDPNSYDIQWIHEAPRSFEGFPIRYRLSGPAIAHVQSGDWVGSGIQGAGTLGGFFEDPYGGSIFAMTCAHVVPACNAIPNTVNRGAGARPPTLGNVVFSELPNLANVPCNQNARPAGGIDAALIDLAGIQPSTSGFSPSVGAVDELDQGDKVIFQGHASGRITACVAAATIWKKINVAGQLFCFSDLFAVGPEKPIYLTASVSRPGDSGAWIYEEALGAPSETWRGMLIAGDQQHNQSLAIHAEHLFNWARTHKSGLTLHP